MLTQSKSIITHGFLAVFQISLKFYYI